MACKILMVTMGLDIGGAETHIVELAKQLKVMGHDVAVVSNGGVYVPEIEKAGIRHYQAPLHRRSVGCMMKSLRILEEVIRQEKPDVVHAHARIPGFLCGLLHKKMGFPFTVGYGMTECAPIITYDDYKTAKLYSCGKIVPNMEMKIDSPDPQNIPGELLVKGANVFLGYYKNEEATREVLDADGWLHTGDMGVIDADGYLFLRGRSKCMILGPSGQNIYPEEVEAVLDTRPYVLESLVIEDNGGLTALIYPDFDTAAKEGMDQATFIKYIEDTLPEVNKELPNYAKLKKIEVMSEAFERTPKKSIKRYLYQRNS